MSSPEPDAPDPVPPEPDATEPDATEPPGPRLVFRHSPLMIVVPIALALFAVPFAFGAPFLWLVYLAPAGLLWWIVRTRTSVDPAAVTVRRMFDSRRVPWAAISSLRLLPATRSRGARVNVVLTGGGELPLPAVHVRDLSQLAAASGGRLPDPAGE